MDTRCIWLGLPAGFTDKEVCIIASLECQVTAAESLYLKAIGALEWKSKRDA